MNTEKRVFVCKDVPVEESVGSTATWWLRDEEGSLAEGDGSGSAPSCCEEGPAAMGPRSDTAETHGRKQCRANEAGKGLTPR